MTSETYGFTSTLGPNVRKTDKIAALTHNRHKHVPYAVGITKFPITILFRNISYYIFMAFSLENCDFHISSCAVSHNLYCRADRLPLSIWGLFNYF